MLRVMWHKFSIVFRCKYDDKKLLHERLGGKIQLVGYSFWVTIYGI